jgi:hypothetical protein
VSKGNELLNSPAPLARHRLLEAIGAAAVRTKKPKIPQHVQLWADYFRSPSMRHLPQRAWLFVLAVLDEHCKHGGKENGNLRVPYSTAEKWLGTSDKTAIHLAKKQATALGHLVATPGRFNRDGTREPTLFRIPWLPGRPGHNGGPPTDPTDEWRLITSDEQARNILKSLKKPSRKSARYRAAEATGQLGTKWSAQDDDKK